MKKLLLTLLLFSCYCANGQYKHYIQKDDSKSGVPSAELGVSGGIAGSSNGAIGNIRLLYTGLIAEHIQLAPQLDFFTDATTGGTLGIGLSVNFPITQTPTYFYPGVHAGYIFANGFSYGVQAGITIAVHKTVGINVETGLRLISALGSNGSGYGSIANTAIFPVLIGARINL